MTGISIPSGSRSDDQLRTARMLPLVLWPIMILATLLLSVEIYVLPENTLRWLGWIVSLNTLGLFSLRLGKRGHARRGGQLFVGGFWALIVMFALTGGGLRAAGVSVFPVLVLAAGLLLGARAGIFTAVLCILSGLFLLFAELCGFLPPSLVRYNAVSLWVMSVLSLAIVVALQFLAARAVQRALQRSLDELAERRRIESALRESEEWYRIAALQTGKLVYDYDLPTGVIQWHGAIERVTGFSPAVFPASTIEAWAEMIHPEDRPRATRELQAAMKEQRSYDVEYRFRCKDGSHVFLDDQGVFLGDEHGKPVRMIGSMGDITSRKQAEDALRHSEEKFRAIVEDQTELIVRWQPDGTRTFVNAAYCRTFGGKYEDFVGSSFYPLVVEEEREMIRRNTASLTPANPVVRETHRSILPSGEICWQEWSDRGIFDSEGRLVEIQSVGRDVTERKRFEERLQGSSEQLRALTSRLQTLREEERTHISREIHDQLGQLLTALKLDLHSLKRITPGIQDADKRDGLARKTDSAIQLADDAIASVQKIATELRPIALDRLGLAAAIEGEAQSFQSRTGVPCETILPVDLIAVPMEHSNAVFRIFQELLTNVTRHARASHVEVQLDLEGKDLLLEVSDDGVGIRESDLAKPTSLGVLGMQERATILGGSVTFARNPDKGTTVTVRVPLTESTGQQP